MSLPFIFALVLVASAVFSVFNDRILRMHRSIGVMLLALSVSLLLLLAKHFGIFQIEQITQSVASLNFSHTLIHGMLGALLFAGGININFDELQPRLVVITVLAVAGVLISTFTVGILAYVFVNYLLGIPLSMVYCLTFGALISPTDPIAVLAILRSIGVSKGLDMDVTGESLFNDGIGFVVFAFFFEMAVHSESMGAGEVSMFFIKSVGGAFVLAALCSYAAFYLLQQARDSHVEIMISLALVFGSFELAEALHVSPAISIVCVGLFFGRLCNRKMSEKGRTALYHFWGVVDEIFNTLLFVMVGLLLLIVPLTTHIFFLGVISVAIVLFGRWISVIVPVAVLKKWYYFSPRSVRIMTWGGLRGGLSMAMALTLPDSEAKNMILWMTYAVVVFSILVQGTTVARVAGQRATHGNEYRDPRLSEFSAAASASETNAERRLGAARKTGD